MDYISEYKRWLSEPTLDEKSREELLSIENNEEEKEFRFSSGLSFGTAGLRGIMMAGTNAMNVYTVAQATQGLANVINDGGKADMGVIVGMDSRNNSRLFAETAASVLAANGIKVYIFEDLRPSPVLSFAVRELGCIAGINVTASHNPAEYNGYKVYWEDGGQLPPDHADAVSKYISAIDIFGGVKKCRFADAVSDGRITVVGKEIDDRYIEEVLEEQVEPHAVDAVADELKIVYTPLHGAGHILVPRVLREIGLKHLYPVEAQMVLDGDFPTVKSPNPENFEAFELGLELAKKVGSDLIIATDPDADRLAVMTRRSSTGEFINLTGNQVGALLIDYIATSLEEQGKMPENPYAIKTIVTTELVTKICEDHGVTLHNVLTGFKFIGEVIKKYEVTGQDTFLFGFEESYGYLKGTYARDKDSVVASMLVTEMAASYMKKGMTLADALDGLFEKYGYFLEGVKNIYMEGLDGLEKMAALMDELREAPPTHIGGRRVVSIRDYLKNTVTDIDTGNVNETGLPISNVLYFVVDNGDRIIMRPSGTEPKIKLYMLTHAATYEETKRQCDAYMKDTDSFVD
ncbi:MAG: phospho-sugar mutase [Clostridia bacterium]|nr:phospho-sugar mutase [Clostridia bacterium]